MTGQPDIAAALAWSGEAARAAANAQAALRGEPVPALLISSEAHLAEAEASPANPYGSSKHGRFDAGSAAEVAEGVERPCLAVTARDGVAFRCRLHGDHEGPHQSAGWPPVTWVFGEPAEDVDTTCTRTRPDNGIYRCRHQGGHGGSHQDITGHQWADRAQGKCPSCGSPSRLDRWDAQDADGMLCEDDWHEPGLCPAQWGEPPDTMLCSLPSGHDGNHATAERIEWAGKWETAEPGDVTS